MTVTAYEVELSIAVAAAAVPIALVRLDCTLAVDTPAPVAWMTAVNVTPPAGGGGDGGGDKDESAENEKPLQPLVLNSEWLCVTPPGRMAIDSFAAL